MKTHLVAWLKPLLFGLALVVLVNLNAEVARGAEVTISGSTTGAITGVPQMSFSGNTNFTGTTALGVGALSGSNNLGTFSLSTAPGQLIAGSFTLNITFTAPTGIAGGQGTTYLATVQGSVSPIANNGGVRIDFNNSPVVFTFNNGNQTGSFSLAVADLSVQSGQTANLTGRFTGSASVANLRPQETQGTAHVPLFDEQSVHALDGIVGPISLGETSTLVDGGANASGGTADGRILLRVDDFNLDRIIPGDTGSRP